MYKWIISSAMLSAVLFGALFIAPDTHAESALDDVYKTTDTISVQSSVSDGLACSEVDITTTWASPNLEEASRYGGAPWASFSTAQRWGVSVQYSGDTKIVKIFWTQDDSLYLEWWAGGVQAKGATNISYAELWLMNDSGYIDCSNVNVSYWQETNSEVIISYADNSIRNAFTYTDHPNYPEDYDGLEVPDSVNPPTPPLDWTPDIWHVQSFDWKILLQDRNFNTFDPVPFTCNEGLTPVIQYDLINNDTDENLDQGIFSPTIQYEFQSEKYGIETEYKFIANYYCGSLDDDPTFSSQTTYYFTLNAAGAFLPDTPSCFTDTFPFIDMEGCTEVTENFINNLTFGKISFPSFSIIPSNCHTLGTLGDWMNVPSSSRVICPQFPQSIRGIVTPFLTFVLGITVMGAIITKSRREVT